MKTTLNLDDELLRRAKRRAAERATTLTVIVEEALRASLTSPAPRHAQLDFPTFRGEAPPDVDPADRGVLYEAMERGEPPAP